MFSVLLKLNPSKYINARSLLNSVWLCFNFQSDYGHNSIFLLGLKLPYF